MSDEQVDYARLSDDELADVAGHIDREAFPERAAIVDAELAKRSAPRPRTAEEIAFDEAVDRGLYLRRATFLSWAGTMALELIVGMPLTIWTGSAIPFVVTGIAGAAVYAVFAIKLSFFTCPRCGRPFARYLIRAEDGFLNVVRGRLRSGPFTSSCVNCGLTHSR